MSWHNLFIYPYVKCLRHSVKLSDFAEVRSKHGEKKMQVKRYTWSKLKENDGRFYLISAMTPWYFCRFSDDITVLYLYQWPVSDQQQIISSENMLTAHLGSNNIKERSFTCLSWTLAKLFSKTDCALFPSCLQRTVAIANGIGWKLCWSNLCCLVSQ